MFTRSYQFSVYVYLEGLTPDLSLAIEICYHWQKCFGGRNA
jgi:hypothetical protein